VSSTYLNVQFNLLSAKRLTKSRRHSLCISYHPFIHVVMQCERPPIKRASSRLASGPACATEEDDAVCNSIVAR
jgi:hypothetical protein